MSLLDSLCNDQIALIFPYLTPQEKVRVGTVCKRLYQLIQDQKVWIDERELFGITPQYLEGKNIVKVVGEYYAMLENLKSSRFTCRSVVLFKRLEGHSTDTPYNEAGTFTLFDNRPYVLSIKDGCAVVWDVHAGKKHSEVWAVSRVYRKTVPYLLCANKQIYIVCQYLHKIRQGSLEGQWMQPRPRRESAAGLVKLWNVSQTEPSEITLSRCSDGWCTADTKIEIKDDDPISPHCYFVQDGKAVLASSPLDPELRIAQGTSAWVLTICSNGKQVSCEGSVPRVVIGKNNGGSIAGDIYRNGAVSAFYKGDKAYVVISRENGDLEGYDTDQPQTPIFTCAHDRNKPHFFLDFCEAGGQQYLLSRCPEDKEIRVYTDPFVNETKMRKPTWWVGAYTNTELLGVKHLSDACMFAFANDTYLATLGSTNFDPKVKKWYVRLDLHCLTQKTHLGTKRIEIPYSGTATSLRIEACTHNSRPYLVAITNHRVTTIRFDESHFSQKKIEKASS